MPRIDRSRINPLPRPSDCRQSLEQRRDKIVDKRNFILQYFWGKKPMALITGDSYFWYTERVLGAAARELSQSVKLAMCSDMP